MTDGCGVDSSGRQGVGSLGYNVYVENPFIALRAVLFDLDGTLIETHIDFGLMKREILGLAGSAGADMAGMELLDILGIVERGTENIARRYGMSRGNQFRAQAFALLEDIEVSHCANPVEIPGAAEILTWLDSAGVAVGIVTRNCRTVSERLVSNAGLIHRVLLTRDDVPRTKPHPSHLLCALSAMGFDPTPDARNPTPYVMVGDHWMDVKAGRAARMRTVGILHGRDSGFFDLDQPDLLVDELADLLPLAKAA